MKKDNYVLHIVLFLLTIVTTMLAGAEWVTAQRFLDFDGNFNFYRGLELRDIFKGASFSFAFLLFLTVHEFGHYFTAVYYKVKTSLPYYIPFFIPGFPMIGSFGAVIRLREMPDSTRKYFDIGIAGPLAGFVVSVGLLWWGFTHLPDKEEYIFNIHPSYETDFARVPSEAEVINFYECVPYYIDSETGDTLQRPEPDGVMDQSPSLKPGKSILYGLLARWLAPDPDQVPPEHEVLHYPFLFVGFITLFFTALNLLPIGQLDGGHVIFGMFGQKVAGIISRLAVVALVLAGGTGLLAWWGWEGLWVYPLYFYFLLTIYRNILKGKATKWILIATISTFILQALAANLFSFFQPSLIWVLYALLAVKVIKVDHPPVLVTQKLGPLRMALGWLAILIFILCFSPQPLVFLSAN